ncbi:patatin-like phospholipase family protein [Streptomyces sp. NPDC052023]|uniref:patatin-like phospholipase family protein n=1 Tax=Streptomyces sp. NPDC052023 TaxID=3365681 RepID=UPI0037D14FF5
MSDAMVMGGGGVGAIAWMTGLLTGLDETGQGIASADLIIGTSAGATVAAQLGSGLSLEELYTRQAEPASQATEIAAKVDLAHYRAHLTDVLQSDGALPGMRRALGRFAMAAETVSETARRAVIESRLPSHEWPTTHTLRIVTVDAETGEPRIFDRASGVSLVDAVAASCAVPGIWPAVTIDGRRYVDGGVRSSVNADYALGASRVLVIAPTGAKGLFPSEKPLDVAVRELRAAGAEVAVLEPDEASLAAIGPNALDPATRTPAAEAGRAQGRGLSIAWRV